MVWHIIISAVLGSLLLTLGLAGREMLSRRTQGMESDARAAALLAAAEAQATAAAAGDSADAAITRSVTTGVSSRRRIVREGIAQRIAEGAADNEIAAFALDTLATGIAGRFTDETQKAQITGRLNAAAPAMRDAVIRAGEEARGAVSLGGVRMALAVTEPWYPVMYYYAVLLGAGAFLVLFALALLVAYLRAGQEKRARLGLGLEPVDYLLPFFLGVVLFTLYPFVRVIVMSFQERYRLEGTFAGWGLGNYEHVMLGVPGTTNYFLQGLGNTLLYVAFTVPISTVLSIMIAWLLNQKLRGSALFQTAYFLPMVTAVTAVGLVWRWIFNRSFGVLNALLGLFGAMPRDWLQAAENSLAVLVIFGVWNTLPFTIILLLSGLQNIDEAYYTVARVDGARAWRIFRRITVPLLAPTIGLVLTINSISAFKVFTEVKVLFNGNPGPVRNLYTVVYYIYDMMYENRELGRAAAAAIVLFGFILVFTVMQRFIQRRWKYD